MTNASFQFPVFPSEHFRFVFVNGQLNSDFSEYANLPKTIKIKTNSHHFELTVCAKTQLLVPIYFVHIYTQQMNKNNIHACIQLEENASVLFLEKNIGEAHLDNFNKKIKFNLNKNSNCLYIKNQTLSENSKVNNETIISQDNNSVFEGGFFLDGGLLTEESVRIDQEGEYAESYLYGLSLPSRDDQAIKQFVEVNHKASFGVSQMFYKGIVNQKSSSIFKGKVCIQENTEKNKAIQQNHHLLLASNAYAKSQPELEIDAEDVQCSHGSTVGQLDQEALFYLCSRGIAEADAKKILIDAFADEIFSHISHSSVKNWLIEQVKV